MKLSIEQDQRNYNLILEPNVYLKRKQPTKKLADQKGIIILIISE